MSLQKDSSTTQVIGPGPAGTLRQLHENDSANLLYDTKIHLMAINGIACIE
jgi:hypothetical protein